MKNFTLIIFAMLAMLKIQAQDYLISFAGTGATTNVGTVKVSNLTSGATATLNGGDILHLTAFVGIGELDKQGESIQLYPNPTTGQAFLTFEALVNGDVIISIVDLSGKTVCQMSKLLSPGSHSFRISGVKQGMYIVKVNGQSYNYSTKLVSLNSLPGEMRIEYISSVNKTPTSRLKSSETTIAMPYTTGDRLLYKSTTGQYSTIVTDVPTSSKTITFNFVACKDADNNNYTTVSIGIQTWMVENLKTTKYRDSTAIPLVPDASSWSNLNFPGYCWFNNDPDNYKNNLGALYNWYVVNTGKLAPAGWHVPSYDEWLNLINYLGGSNIVGGKLKETGTVFWQNPNAGATNEYGFTGRPGGIRSVEGYFYSLGTEGYWWSSTKSSNGVWYSGLKNDTIKAIIGNDADETPGLSVRCIWDITGTPVIPTVTTTSLTKSSYCSVTSGGYITSQGGVLVTARGLCWNTTGFPTTADNKTIDGKGAGNFLSVITGLNGNTTYYVRAYATNIAGSGYGNQEVFTTQPSTGKRITDIDGNVYNTVTIGSQVWMTENLKTTKYNDGTLIPNVVYASTPGYCWYMSDIVNKNTYGALYNWYAVNTGKLAPIGWHVASNEEWATLTTYLGGVNVAGKKLKETGITRWQSPNEGTNEYGFTALPGGGAYVGSFEYLGNQGDWWSSTAYSTEFAYGRTMDYSNNNLAVSGAMFQNCYSIRCVKDLPDPNQPSVITTIVSDILQNTATGGGNVTSNGIAAISARGVCWSSLPNPTITGRHTIDGSFLGNYTSNLTGLNANMTYYVRAYATNSAGTAYGNEVEFKTLAGSGCGSITVNHIAGTVAPVSKIITYSTVNYIPGEPSKCWITSNLGADHEATSINDSTEASAGWYWQFNRKQGFKHDGTTRTPNTTWITSISENSDWTSTNDPCTIELGADWRIPTSTEWSIVNGASGGNWTNSSGPWNSGLKLHCADELEEDGSLLQRGYNGIYWSSTQYDDTYGRMLIFHSSVSTIWNTENKDFGHNIRCLKGVKSELPSITTSAVIILSPNTATSGGNIYDDGGSLVTTRGICYSTNPTPTLSNSFTNDGTGSGSFSSSLSGLIPNVVYYVRAYATNSLGTSYGNQFSFATNAYAGNYQCVGYRIRPGNPTEPVNAVETLNAVDSNTVKKTGFGNFPSYDIVIDITTDLLVVGGTNCFKVIATPIDPNTGLSVGGMLSSWQGDAATTPAPPANPTEINYYNPVVKTFVLNCYYTNTAGNRIMYEVLTRL